MVAALCGFPTRPRPRPHAGPAPRRRYERRRPEKTPLHKVISENLTSWLEWRDQAERPVPGYVEEEFRAYLECGILCFGFGRAVCTGCGQGFVIAFSCQGRGVCPSCNGRHMAQTAAHLVDHVIPPVPVRQWVISVPKRLRGFLADRPAAVAALTKIFLAEIERLLCAAAGVTTGANTPTASRPRLGAVSFLHRFGSALNRHVHLHACVTDGVFTPPAAGSANDAPPGFLPAFLPVRPINPADLAALTERARRRLIRWFRRTRLLDAEAAADMLRWENSGFSIDASVRIALSDRDVPSFFKSLEHLLRYCARPPFALERRSVTRDTSGRATKVRYVLPRHKAATWVGPGRGRKSTRPGASGVVELTPFEFLDRLADLVPPPRRHRPAGDWRGGRAKPWLWLRTPEAAGAMDGPAAVKQARGVCTESQAQAGRHGARHREHRQAARGSDRWACGRRSRYGGLLRRESESKAPLARHVTDCLGETPGAGGGGVSTCVPHLRRRHPADRVTPKPGPIRKILTHLGEPLEPPPVSPARGPPTDWGEVVQIHDDRDVFQASPDELPAIDIHRL